MALRRHTIPISAPTPAQLHLLRGIVLGGGQSIVRHCRFSLTYEALEAAGLIKAFKISKNETRYNITTSGRMLLEERSSSKDDG